ncbi:MAG: bifunctional phosphopantothenoylcysteine decarboxylase/phosphopantothenate--cysteine ligase CoaBC, partial [bacterium]
LLTTVLLATRAPVLMAPAMNDRMWAHPQTKRNATHLVEELRYELAGPAAGPLAVGEGEGPGRMVEPAELVDRVGRLLGRREPWQGRRVVVTAGPTREPLDAVRFVGNRSSGRMGYALAREAYLRGCDVTLVTGPSALPAPVGVRMVRVETARQMLDAVDGVVDTAHLVVYAAAVADYRPEEPSSDKRSRRETGASFEVRLVENPDVAGETRSRRPAGSVAVGFALETRDLETRARQKLEEKGFDMIVANPAGEPGVGFDARSNRGLLVRRKGEAEEFPVMPKERVAGWILDRVEPLLTSGGDGS